MKFKQHGKRPDWRALLAVWLTLAFLTAAGFAAYSAWQTSRIGFAVHFVDVGQGDGAIVVCDGKTLVIDGGTAENGAKMVEYLQNTLHVSKVDFVIGTHPHADHIGGLPDVIRACKVKKLYSPVDEFEAKTFETMKRAADDKKLKITVPQAGQSFSLGRAKVEFLAPLGIYDNVNDLSLVIRITYGQTAFLFTGDAERPSEYDMTDSGRTCPPRCSKSAIMAATRPRLMSFCGRLCRPTPSSAAERTMPTAIRMKRCCRALPMRARRSIARMNAGQSSAAPTERK